MKSIARDINCRPATSANTHAEGKTDTKAKPSRDVIDFIMTCIIEFGKRHDLSIREASNYLIRFNGIDFLHEFYDIEHTLSFDDCIDDVTIICNKNGGALK